MTKISPSILASDFAYIADTMKLLESADADYVHCDVMDGRFVPNITFGSQMIESIKRQTNIPLDVHLMIVHPENHIESFAKAGADLITFHPETCFHPHRVLGAIKSLGKKAGVVLNPGVPVCNVVEILSLCDVVLLMSVNPGFGGQKLIPETFEKAKALAAIRKEKGFCFEIEIDGGINLDNAQTAIDAGIDILVAGSAIFEAKDPKSVVTALRGNAR